MRGGATHEPRELWTLPAAGEGPADADTSDEGLAGRASRGDAGALSLLLSRWQDPMLRFCRRMLRHEEDARDLAQDVLLRAARGIDGFDVDRPFAAWIYRIGRNACLNHIEREKHRRTVAERRDPVGRTLPPDVLVARREEVARVRRALRRLQEPDRKLLEMKLVQGLSNAEMANRLGLAPGALRTRACRALGRLRAAMEATGKEVRR